MGRPSKYTPELVAEIANRLAKGEPLAVICRDDGFPDPSTVRDWMRERDDVSLAIARAREDGEDWIAADCLAIVDNVDEEPASRRVRAETRLKLLAKWNPKKWGERMQLAGDPEQPLMALPEAKLAARVAELVAKAKE